MPMRKWVALHWPPMFNVICLIAVISVCGRRVLAANTSQISQASENSFVIDAQPSSVPCFSGSPMQRGMAANKIIGQISGIYFRNGMTDFPMSRVFQGAALTKFYVSLVEAVRAKGCVFARGNVKVDSYYDVIRALALHTYKSAPDKEIPTWLKPGQFVAVLGALGSDSTIIITTNRYGFLFHTCDAVSGKPPGWLWFNDPSKCRSMLGSAAFVPVDQFLRSTTGVGHIFMVILKAFSSVGLIVTSNLSLAVASPVAHAAVKAVNPTPLADYEQEYNVGQMVKQTIEMGNLREHNDAVDPRRRGKGVFLVTRFFPNVTFDQLTQNLMAVIQKILSPDLNKLNVLNKHPDDVHEVDSPMEIQERKFFKLVNQAKRDALTQNNVVTQTPN